VGAVAYRVRARWRLRWAASQGAECVGLRRARGAPPGQCGVGCARFRGCARDRLRGSGGRWRVGKAEGNKQDSGGTKTGRRR